MKLTIHKILSYYFRFAGIPIQNSLLSSGGGRLEIMLQINVGGIHIHSYKKYDKPVHIAFLI